MEPLTILFVLSMMIFASFGFYIFVTSFLIPKISTFDTNPANANTQETAANALPDTIVIMMEMIQQHSNYKIMQQHNPLSTGELIALIIYTYSRSYCQKMKQFRNVWYCAASNAVNKIHSVLHYQNDQTQPKMLFHGTNNPSFDQFSQQKLVFTEFCSFTTTFSVAQKFATGSILVITDVDKRLYSGQLKGADISWISPYDEHEWIILPTTFHNWREMSKQEIIDHGWQISDGIKVYITDEYESNVYVNKDLQDNYNMGKSIKYWFDNEFGIIFTPNDSEKYFDLFIENGYDTFELIRRISCGQDLNEIGIIKIAHVNCILTKIETLDEYLKNEQHKINVDELSKIIKDIEQCKDGYSCARRRNNRVICRCEWVHHDTIPTHQFAPISPEDRKHIAEFHPDLHRRLTIHKQQ